MKIKIELDDLDIYLRLTDYSNDYIRTGVLIEFFKCYDRYEPWQEEEKLEDINKIICQINDALTPEYKERLIVFMEKLTNKLKGNE